MLRGRGQRRLATVLFVDVADSTRIAADVGDRRWRELVRVFRTVVRRRLREHDGHEVDTAGDGFFAWFERPASALRAAGAIVGEVQQHGLDVRCGLHTGELETIDGRLGGIAAHIGARVMAAAGPAEIFVTNTLRELVTGGEVGFELVGERELKGVPGRWTLHRLTTLAGQPAAAPLTAAEGERRRGLVAAPVGRRRGLAWAWIAGVASVALVAMYLLRAFIGGPAPSASASPSPTQVAGATPSGSPSRAPTDTVAPSPTPYRISLVAIDPASNRLTIEVRDEYATGRRSGLIVADGNLWVNDFDTVLRRRDLATGAYLETLELPAVTWRVQVAFGSIWVFHGIPRSVVDRHDPLSLRRTDRIDPSVDLYDGILGDSSLYLLAVGSRVLEYDQLSNELVDDDPTGTETQPVYIGYQDGMVYLNEARARRMAKFDPDTDQIVGTFEGDRYAVGGAAREPATGTLWATDFVARTITPYESEDGPAGTALGLMGPPRQVAFGFASVWVAAEGWVHRISSGGSDRQDIAMPEGAKAVSIGIDEPTNKIWVALCYGSCPR